MVRRNGALGIATHVVSAGELQKATTDLALKLSTGPTRAYAAIKGLMKAWSPGVAAADLLLSDLSADLYESKDAAAAWKEAEELAKHGHPLPGMTKREVDALLPDIFRTVRAWVAQANSVRGVNSHDQRNGGVRQPAASGTAATR